MRCAVLGSPIEHSLSPAMHRAAYAELGLDWTYEAIELPEGGLAAFLADRDDSWRGFSVTMPLKRELVAVADEVSGVAAELGVANTLVLEGGRRVASNTDVPGAAAALREAGVGTAMTARILGGGATATSMAHALAELGVAHLELIVREPARADGAVSAARAAGVEVAVRRLAEPMIDVVDVLVSTVPSGIIGSRSHELVDSARAVFDVVYDPWPTTLGAAAAEHGTTFVSGLDLLAHQAALQVRLMTGTDVPVHTLRDAAVRQLADR